MTVIGDLLMWYGDVRDKISAISPDDFYLNDVAAAFNAIKQHSDTGADTIDILSLPQSINEVELLPVVKKALTMTSTSMHFDSHLSALKNLSFNRRVKTALMGIATEKGDVRLDEVQNLLDREKSGAYVRSWIDKSQAALDKFIDNIGKPVNRIFTGFSMLDKLTGGMRIPSVMMIGAYPSTGKTTFALNIGMYQTGGVAVFSLEMSAELLYERVISAESLIDYDVFGNRKFTPTQKQEIEKMGAKLKDMKKYFFDDIYDVETQSTIVASIKPALVIVDYIQKVRTTKKADSRREEIEYISGMYKQIANYNQCCVILLSQIGRADKDEPTMSSLKESGALEADGDYVGLLHRPHVLRKNDPQISPEEAYILIDKNKFGKTGKKDLRFDLKHQKFYEKEEPYRVDKYPPKRRDRYYDDNPFT